MGEKFSSEPDFCLLFQHIWHCGHVYISSFNDCYLVRSMLPIRHTCLVAEAPQPNRVVWRFYNGTYRWVSLEGMGSLDQICRVHRARYKFLVLPIAK